MFTWKTIIKTFLVTGCALAFNWSAYAADCGEVPVVPEIVDGASASMEALVENSEAVKAFISSADAYLDCREQFMATKDFKELEKSVQESYKEANRVLLQQRNGIGDDFNKQVAAYKAANP